MRNRWRVRGDGFTADPGRLVIDGRVWYGRTLLSRRHLLAIRGFNEHDARVCHTDRTHIHSAWNLDRWDCRVVCGGLDDDVVGQFTFFRGLGLFWRFLGFGCRPVVYLRWVVPFVPSRLLCKVIAKEILESRRAPQRHEGW